MISRLRIALLFATSGHSGVDRVIRNLLKELGDTPFYFDLIVIGKHGPYPEKLPENVTLRRLPVNTKKLVVFPLTFYLLRFRPFSLLTANHQMNRAALLARAITRSKCRIVIRMGTPISARAKELGKRHGKKLLKSMARWYPRADAVIAPSSGVGEDLKRFAKVTDQQLHVIGNPIVNVELEELANEAVADPWFDDTDNPVILATGSLEPVKDFSTLIRAFVRLRQQRSCRLIILGEGRERARLEALARELGIAEDVHMPGYEPNPYRYMKRAAAFVLCSRREGSGAVLVEALACGTPVVATDCPVGPAEILRGGEIGPLVPVGDDVLLAAAIEKVLREPSDAALLRAAAEPFRSDHSAARYLAALGIQPDTEQ